MERNNNRLKVSYTFLLLIQISFATHTSSSPWPYLQTYPPVNETDGRTPLYFALMLSFGGDYTSIGALPGVQIALDYINSDPSILPGYTLHYTLTDSRCNRTTAIDSFFREMIPSPIKVGWVGSGCAVATEPTAELSQFYNITQLSCASVSPKLFYESEFRSYFQLLSSATHLSRGFSGIIRAFNWKRVALITQNELVFVKIMDDLKKELSNAGVHFTEKVFATADSISGLGNEPFDPDARIFVWAMYSSHARELACEAYRHGLQYPINQFLLFGWYGDGWLVEPDLDHMRQLNCTLEDRVQTLNYALTVKMLDYNTNENLVTEGGLTLHDFEEQYREKLKSPINDELSIDKYHSGSNIFPYAQHCHEATIALAYALNKTCEDLRVNQTLNMEAGQQPGPEGEAFSLANFTYSNSAILRRMVSNLNKTDFLGISGNLVRFNENIRSVNMIVIHQHRPAVNKEKHDVVKTGIVPVDTEDFSYVYDGTREQMWPRGIPSDGITERVIVTVATPLTVVYSILSIVGICFAIVCLVFNFKYRENKLMVLSSMRINYTIGAGSILFYLNIAIAVIPSTQQLACSINCSLIPVIASIAFSLSNGTIVMKMVRLWYISNRPKLSRKRAIKDIHILVAVMILLTLDVLVILFYFILAGLRQELGAILIPNRENPTDIIGPTEIFIKNFFYVCSLTGPNILFTLLLGFKIFLMIVALILALRTRKLKVSEGLDNSKFIAASVYISNITAVVTTVSSYSLIAYVNVSPAVQGLAQFTGTTIILCLIFVPKMVALYRDPDGDRIVSASTTMGSTHQYTVTSQDELKLESLKQRVKELEASLKECGVEVDQDDEDPQQTIASMGQDSCSDDTAPDTQSPSCGPEASRNFMTEQ